MPFTYEYPRPMVTVDTALVTVSSGKLKILLIRRKNDPFAGSFALPGGFLEMDEDPLAGAARELQEETGLTGIPLNPVFTCGQAGRDPRGRCITMVFAALVRKKGLKPVGGDDASEADWHSVMNPPALAFDHATVLQEIICSLQWQAKTSVIGRNFLNPEFSETEISELHSIVANSSDSESPVSRGKKLGILESGKTPGTWKFRGTGYNHPDFTPVVW